MLAHSGVTTTPFPQFGSSVLIRGWASDCVCHQFGKHRAGGCTSASHRDASPQVAAGRIETREDLIGADLAFSAGIAISETMQAALSEYVSNNR
jgi:hypothetical protein